MKLIKNEKINSCLTDPLANLSVIGCFQIAEEAVTELMGMLKIDGITVKKLFNAVWVFYKSKLKLLKNISWNEQCTVVGFISKITRISIDIDVEIRNEINELCMYFRVQLCALDIETGKILRVSAIGVDDSISTEDPEIDISFSKFDVENLPKIEQVKVKYTSIDFAGHTNNKEYIRFILNAYSVSELETNPIKEMDVVYVNQTYENDILTIHKSTDMNNDIFLIEKDENIIFKCKIVRGDTRLN